MKSRYNLGVFIGRFQPFHLGHLHNLRIALNNCDQVVVIIGSAYRARTIKNPFTFLERKKMIESDLSLVLHDYKDRIFIRGVSDWLYDEKAWVSELISQVEIYNEIGGDIVIIGHEKDESSYYLKCFPEWGFLEVDNYLNYNATDFRKEMFANQKLIKHNFLVSYSDDKLVHSSFNFIKRFMKSVEYNILVEEYRYVQYKEKSYNFDRYPHHEIGFFILYKDYLLVKKNTDYPFKNLIGIPSIIVSDIADIGGFFLEKLGLGIVPSQIYSKIFKSKDRGIGKNTSINVYSYDLSSLLSIRIDIKGYEWLKLSKVLVKQSECMDDHYQIILNIVYNIYMSRVD